MVFWVQSKCDVFAMIWISFFPSAFNCDLNSNPVRLTIMDTGNKTVDTRRKLFADVQGGSSSVEEPVCCTKLALSVYKKAFEGAKKSLPR